MAESPNLLLQADAFTVRYQSHTVLENVSLRITRGEIVTIIGPNGSGKTTLLKAVLGLIPVTSGTVRKVAGLKIGYVPQRVRFEPTMPITADWYLRLNARHALTPALIEKTGIAGYLHYPMHALSGGEMQRVLLTRALLSKPDLLVLDEPVQGVDVSGQAATYDLIRTVRDEFGCGVLMVSHDLHLVMAATDHVLCLNHHVCWRGASTRNQQRPGIYPTIWQTCG